MKKASFAIMLVLLAIVVAISLGPVQAKQSWTVTAGGAIKGFAVVTNTYQPRNIEVAVGDTVTWKYQEFHTVTFLGGQPPLNPFVQEGNRLIGNPQVFFPTGDKTYDGTGFRNSGTPPLDIEGLLKFRYSLTFTKSGSYEYVCLIHGPLMNGTVVVKDRVSVTSAAFTKRAQAEQAASLKAGEAVWAKFKPERQGNNVVITLTGDQNTGFSIYRFTREPLVISRGTTVTWQVRDPFEIHTVTFLSGQKPPDFVVVEPQKGGPPKLVFPEKAVQPTQTKTYAGTGYVNSGILFPPGTPGNPPSSFSLTFTKPGRYEYRCLVHDDPEKMLGTIIVK